MEGPKLQSYAKSKTTRPVSLFSNWQIHRSTSTWPLLRGSLRLPLCLCGNLCAFSLTSLPLFLRCYGFTVIKVNILHCLLLLHTHTLTRALTLPIPPHAFHSYSPMTMFHCFPRWPWTQDKLNVLNSMYVNMLDSTLINLFKDQQISFYCF